MGRVGPTGLSFYSETMSKVMLGVYSTMQVDATLCIQITFQKHTVIQFAAHTVMLM